MAAPRVDPYTPIHKALRAVLYDIARTAGSADFVDEASAKEALASIRHRVGLVRDHGTHEDRVIQAEIARVAPDLAKGIADDHHAQEKSLDRFEQLLAAIENAPPAERVGHALEVYRAANRFISAYLTHLDQEETVILPTLWKHYSDDEIAGMRARIQAEIPPPRFAEWMQQWIPALNATELGGMLAGMKATAPPEVFDRIAGLARNILGDAKWAVVRTRGNLG